MLTLRFALNRLSYSVVFRRLLFRVRRGSSCCVRFFDCSGRRLVDVVQVQVAHVRRPGSRPHLKGQR